MSDSPFKKLPTCFSVCSSCLFILFVFTVFIAFPANALGYDLILEWDQNANPETTGYKVYYGVQSRTYTTVLDVGNVTSCALSGFEEGQTYYFAVTAYNDFGESDYSEEILYTMPVSINEPPVADAGRAIIVKEGATVILSGVNSFDPDDGIASYQWTLKTNQNIYVNGTGSDRAVFTAPKITPSMITMLFTLTVRDHKGQTDSDDCIVRVVKDRSNSR